MDHLINGYREFHDKYFKSNDSVYKGLINGQSPKTLVIACSDSRVDPAILFNAEPGEIFAIRNVANIVPKYSKNSSAHSVGAALEFAVCVLKISNIIVLGHSNCAGVAALIDPSRVEHTDFVKDWVLVADDAKAKALGIDKDSSTEPLQHVCEKQVILASVNNLKSYPWVADRIKNDGLQIDGCYFDIKAGAVKRYQEDTDSFVEL